MVLLARNSLVALLVALCATVSLAASIATTGPSTSAETTAAQLSTSRSDEVQKEATFNRTDSRTENARSLDIDINKYTSVDFHNKVYDLPSSPENDKFISQEVSKVHTTYRTSFTSQNVNNYESDAYELTTPRSTLFDLKHKQLQNEIKQRLQIVDNVDPEPTEQIEKPRDHVEHNKTNFDLVRYTNVLADDDVRNETSIHRNYEAEKVLKVNYESVYNQSQPVGDTVHKVHSAKSPLLNNKIENDKAINISKRGFTKQPQTGNSTDRSMVDLQQDRSNLIPTLESTTANQEQTQQENNIYPVLVPIPLTTAAPPSTDASHTRLYEMTENDFVTTSESAFEADVGSEEKFYEMTETATALSTWTADVETTLGNQISRQGPTDNYESGTTTIIPSTTDGDGTTLVAEMSTTDLATEISTTEQTTLETTTITGYIETTEKELVGSTLASQITTETEIVSTVTPHVDDATTTESAPIMSTIPTIETSTDVIENNQSNEAVTFETTTTESPYLSVPTLISVITTTIQQIADTTITTNPNKITKDHGSVVNSTVVQLTNEIRKDNKTASEHEMDDLIDEVTDDDYIDARNVKPMRTTTIEPRTDGNETVIETTERVTTTSTTTPEAVTNDEFTVGGVEDSSRANDQEGTSSGTIIAIVLSTVGAICLILLAILLFVMRRRQKRFNYGQRCRPVSLDDYSMDNVSVYNSVRRKAVLRGSKRSCGNPAFEDDTSVTNPLNFQALTRFAGNDDDIRAEFEEIPLVSVKRSELPEGCAAKNRYANVIPLPETRVMLAHLEDDPISDFINANYVTGPKAVRGYYIACQAPLHNTVNDFWRMIWEQQSKVILMLTHLFENGVEKCVDYLPPSEVVDCHRLFGDYQVTLKKREVKDKYIISSLQLKNMVSNSWREVTHLWYSGWPEKGVPEEENSIIAFLIEARSYIKLVQNSDAKENGITSTSNGIGLPADSSPVVVHCSPGTGRTGSVIACDIAIREFELRRIVDIPRIVYRIRRDRASSVQTKDQYHFIYKVINLYATKLTGGALDSI